ncbi:hypothetical protein DVH24_032884 [Malus domestica]|uniref:Uncharacterized protein n=1 Tax=Malus domestica TaxID=3750 RepID=A0A498IMZ1_MALDO|nr:hypothetical protein DVH24_032884 [Malus domestica]
MAEGKWRSNDGRQLPPVSMNLVVGKRPRSDYVMLYDTECWAVKHQHVHKMGVAEMRMLRGMCGHTRKDKIGNEDIRGKEAINSASSVTQTLSSEVADGQHKLLALAAARGKLKCSKSFGHTTH